MRTTHRLFALATTGVFSASLTACGSTEEAAKAEAGPITVSATDTSCEVATTTVNAGTSVFAISNKGQKVTEFYVYAAGDRVMAEVENIAPGLSRNLHVELPAGTYETACKPGMIGKGIRGALQVEGSAAPLTEDAALLAATESYQRYVKSQTAALLEKTGEFVQAVKDGEAEKAKELFPVARTYWERIEPVAEIFGDLDPRIDGREEVTEEGLTFGGFHRIEKDLWETKDISKSGPIADQLLTDVKEIVTKANAEKLSPLQLANGAKALLDEVASGKITGEEDRYSHTDLWDFNANIEGSKAAIASLRPVLEERDPELVKTLDTEFATVDTALAAHRSGDGWKLHTDLTEADLKTLSDAINALAEPISKVAAVVSGK
ncbi:MAG TPA: iron uptake system protein EfeO [Actinoplanes sp.]|nr:iron uptake system protein EfeO [Actinoplanes sp.]